MRTASLSVHSAMPMAFVILTFVNPVLSQNLIFKDVTSYARVAMPTDPNGYGHGVAIADFNNDGLPDLYLVSYDAGNSLFRNNGNGRFTDVAGEAGVREGSQYDRGVAAADYDNDGDVDLYIAAGAASPHLLYRNNGDGSFEEVGNAAGLRLQGFQGQGVAWGDFDSDGLLDLLLPSYDHTARLYRQDADHHFHDVSQEAGIIATDNAVQAIFFDMDLDGNLDIFVSRGSGYANRMFRNQGNGRFQDEAAALHLEDPSPHGQGVTVADYDNDGDFDLYMSSSNGPNRLYRNDRELFREVASAAGVADASRSLGCMFADFDNDGWSDLYVGNFGANRMYRNKGNGTFAEVSSASHTDHNDRAYGTGVTDYNGDGLLDIFFSNSGQPSVLLQNESAVRHWLKVDLVGKETNRNGVGAIIRVEDGTRKQMQQLVAGYSMVSGGGDLTFHFGLGANTMAQRLEVQWPSGKKDVLLNVAGNHALTIVEGSFPPDTTAPQISNLTALAKSDTSVLITWSTDEPAMAQVEYGTTTAYGDTTATIRVFAKRHAFLLTGLQTKASYHYRVRAQDSLQNLTVSNDAIFTARQTESPQTMQKVRVQNITSTSAEVTWQTNEFATAWLEFGPDTSRMQRAGALSQSGQFHRVELTGLAAQSSYFYRAFSRISSHELLTSQRSVFTTAPDSSAPPIISNVVIHTIGSRTAVVTWKTSVASAGEMEYGIDDTFDQLAVQAGPPNTTHEMTLQNLAANRLYRFRVRASRLNGETVKSAAQQFVTKPDNGDLASNVELLGFLSLSGYPTVADVWGYADSNREYALVCLRRNGLAIVDVTDPRHPASIANVTSFGNDLHTVKVYRHYALAINEYGPMEIVDLSNPNQPEIVALYNTSFSGGHNAFVEGHYVYVVGTHPVEPPDSDERSGLHVIDLTNPTQPKLAGKREGFYIHDLFVQNDTAFVGGYRSHEVQVWEASDKSNLRSLATFSFRYPHTVRRGGNASVLILNDEGKGQDVQFWDIHDPHNARKVGSYITDPEIAPHNVEPLGNLAFIAYFEDMLRIVDYGDPANPVEAGFYDTYPENPSHGQPLGAHQTAAWGVYPHTPSGNIYISDMSKGLYIFRYAPAGPVPASSTRPTRDSEMVKEKPAKKSARLAAPRSFALSNYPNPFQAARGTTLYFELPHTSEIELSVHDINGRLVQRLAHAPFAAGGHNLRWNGETGSGLRAAAGIYLLRMRYRTLPEHQTVALVRRLVVLP